MPVFERQLKAIEGFISSEWVDSDGFFFLGEYGNGGFICFFAMRVGDRTCCQLRKKRNAEPITSDEFSVSLSMRKRLNR